MQLNIFSCDEQKQWYLLFSHSHFVLLKNSVSMPEISAFSFLSVYISSFVTKINVVNIYNIRWLWRFFHSVVHFFLKLYFFFVQFFNLLWILKILVSEFFLYGKITGTKLNENNFYQYLLKLDIFFGKCFFLFMHFWH